MKGWVNIRKGLKVKIKGRMGIEKQKRLEEAKSVLYGARLTMLMGEKGRPIRNDKILLMKRVGRRVGKITRGKNV